MALKFEISKHEDAKKEAAKAGPKYKYTEEFIVEFTDLWEALKAGHHLDKANVTFDSVDAKNKWFRMAKAYGAQNGVNVSVADVEDTKNTPRLHVRMEDAKKREVRLAEMAKRAKLIQELKDLGGEVKRGAAAKDWDVEAEIKRLKAKAAKDAPKAPETPKGDTAKRPSVPPVPGMPAKRN